MSVPSIDPEARAAALEKARASRRIRAELKLMLKSGEVSLAEVLDRTEVQAVARMRVTDVLEAMPATGPVKAERLMEQIGIATSRRLGGLGPRQRDALLEHFA